MTKQKTYPISIEVRHNYQIYGNGTIEIRPTKQDVQNLRSEMDRIGLVPDNNCTELVTIDICDARKSTIGYGSSSVLKPFTADMSHIKIFMCLNPGCCCPPTECPKNIVNGKCQNDFIRRTIYKHLFEKQNEK